MSGPSFLLETEEGDLITILHKKGGPKPTPGLARKPHNLAIIQDGVTYTIAKIVYHQDRIVPSGNNHPRRKP